MRKKNVLKAAIPIVLFSLFIFSFAYYGGRFYEQLFQSDEPYDKGTVIGPESVAGMTETEAARHLTAQVEDWRTKSAVTLRYMEKEADMNENLIEFQTAKSISDAVDGRENNLYADVSDQLLLAELESQFPGHSWDKTDVELLASDLSDIGSHFQTGDITVDLSAYVPKESRQEIVAKVSMAGASSVLQSFVEQNPSILIPASGIVSFNEWMIGTNDQSLDEKSIGLLSSSLYQLVLQTNFAVLEKNQSTSLPDYIPLGFEAKVSMSGKQDFVFRNENQAGYTAEWSVSGGRLNGVIKGVPFYYDYEPVLKNKETIQPKTILQFSPSLEYGKVRLERMGSTGQMADAYRVVKERTVTLREEQIAGDFYPPIHTIELHSSKEEPVSSNEGHAPNGGSGTSSDSVNNGTAGGNGSTGSIDSGTQSGDKNENPASGDDGNATDNEGSGSVNNPLDSGSGTSNNGSGQSGETVYEDFEGKH